MDDAISRWTSRKLWVMVGFELIFVALLWYSKLPVEAFVSLSYLLLGSYFVSNVTQKYILSQVK
jgi:hypothetical protein